MAYAQIGTKWSELVIACPQVNTKNEHKKNKVSLYFKLGTKIINQIGF